MTPQPVEVLHGRRQTVFAKADRFLARYYRPVQATLNLSQGLVSFTFDDIPDNAALIGAPVLEKYDARGTFYIAGKLCGRSFRHDVFADGALIRDIAARGHEIGCHTYSHADSQRLSLARQRDEFSQNNRFLSGDCALSTPVTHAYPYGSVGLVQKYGASGAFAAARGVRPGLNSGQLDLMQLFAVPLYDHLYTREAIAEMIQEAADKKAWLIFYSHDVAEIPSDQGSSSALLNYAAGEARAAGCNIKTVADAVSLICQGSG